MRKLFTITFTIICLTGYSQSQVGLKLGVLQSRFIPKSDSIDGSFTGFSIGGFSDIKLTDWLYVSPEILIVNRGNNTRGFIPGVWKDTTIHGFDSIQISREYNGRFAKTVHYLEIPLQLKIKHKGLYLSSGVSFGFKYLERRRFKRGSEIEFVKQEEINDIDINLINSLGYQYKGYIIELRNMYSLASGYGKSVSVGLNLGLKF